MKVTVSKLRGRVEVSDGADTVTVTVDDYGEVWVWHGSSLLTRWQAHCRSCDSNCRDTLSNEDTELLGNLGELNQG
jgi:hypothetical protein